MFTWVLAVAFAVGLLLLALMEIEIVRLRRGRARMQQLVQLKASDGPPIHKACGIQMTATMISHDNPVYEWRSRPVWLCVRCSAWEPDGWTA